jgi:hypothetical protein
MNGKLTKEDRINKLNLKNTVFNTFLAVAGALLVLFGVIFIYITDLGLKLALLGLLIVLTALAVYDFIKSSVEIDDIFKN